MSSPFPSDGEFDGALTDALNRRAASVHTTPADGRARFEQHLAADTRHRHRRRVAMSVTGVVAVLALGAGAIAFANGRDSRPSQTVTAAADQLKIRVPSAPSGLPKLLPTVPDGWVLENAGDYAPFDQERSTLPDRGTNVLLLFRSDSAVLRVDIHSDPNVAGGFSIEANGDPNAKTVQVHGQPALLTVEPKTLSGVDMLQWAEGEHTIVTVMASGVTEAQLVAFGESLQPAAEGWNAFPLPEGFTLAYSGDPDAPMGYGGPSWQLGYRGPEDLSQPQDPSITVSAAKGTPDALVVFPGPGDHPDRVSVANQPAIYLAGPPGDPAASTYCTLVWFDEASGLVMTMNAIGVSRNDMISFAASFHSVPDDEWQNAVAAVLAKADEPTGPVEPPVPTQPEAFPNLAAGSLPDGRAWTINATRYRDEPEANLVCGDLTIAGSDAPVGGACANADGSPRPGISIGTDGSTLVFGAVPSSATAISVEMTGSAPITAPTVASSDASIDLHWFVVEVPDSTKLTAIVGLDESGTEVLRIAQPLGPPYPDYGVLDKAEKREIASDTVDGARWTLVAADAPLSDGSGPVTCVTLTFASESSMTCPVVAVGGVNGNGIIDATVAILRKRMFVLAHLEPGVAELCVTTEDQNVIRVPVIPTGSASGSTVAVVRVPDDQKPLELHAIDAQGQDMGTVDISQLAETPKPMPFGVADSTRSAVGYVGTPNTAAG